MKKQPVNFNDIIIMLLIVGIATFIGKSMDATCGEMLFLVICGYIGWIMGEIIK